jgi:hypothetical protein
VQMMMQDSSALNIENNFKIFEVGNRCSLFGRKKPDKLNY